jgi:hypothetical protein
MGRLFLAAAVLAASLALVPPASGTTKSATKTCNGTFTGASFKNVVVPDNGVCRLIGSKVSGDVSVKKKAYFEASNTDVGGSLEARDAQTLYIHDGSSIRRGLSALGTHQVFAFDSTIAKGSLKVRKTPNTHGKVNVCGMRVSGDITIVDSGSDILVGDPLAVDCAGNTAGGDVNVSDNRVWVELVVRGNRIGDDLNVNSNKGSADKFVSSNAGGDRLSCKGNQQPFQASANTGWKKSGQCS